MTLRLAPHTLPLALLVVLSTSAVARADVILTFGSTATSFGDGQLITAIFDLPFSDGPYDTLTAEFSSDVTDSSQSGAVNVNPVDASGFILVPHIDGVAVPLVGLGTGCTPTGLAGFTTVCDPHSTASISVSTLASGSLKATVLFTLTGFDNMSFEGTLTLSNSASVPEPASLLLLALGGAAVAARRWRSRSA